MAVIRKTRRAMTLLEIMIVIFIIGIISSVIGYNMKGSLEKAKAFKTTEGIEKKIKEIFELELAQGTTTIQRIIANPAVVLENSGFVTNPQEFLKDGWGIPYEITQSKLGKIVIHSSAYKAYENKKNAKNKQAFKEEDLIAEASEEDEE